MITKRQWAKLGLDSDTYEAQLFRMTRFEVRRVMNTFMVCGFDTIGPRPVYLGDFPTEQAATAAAVALRLLSA